MDLVPLYPSKLWAEAGAPLQCLADLRAWYLATYGDQFFAPSPPAQIPSFFPLFALLELLFHLPVSLWAVRRLAGGKAAGGGKGGVKGKGAALRGKDELLLLVYGIETALTTATCMYEAYLWDPALVSARQKVVLLGGLYGGYLALGTLFLSNPNPPPPQKNFWSDSRRQSYRIVWFTCVANRKAGGGSCRSHYRHVRASTEAFRRHGCCREEDPVSESYSTPTPLRVWYAMPWAKRDIDPSEVGLGFSGIGPTCRSIRERI